jgi:hypothetical protein
MLLEPKRHSLLVELIKYAKYHLNSEIAMMSVRLMLRLSLASDGLGNDLAKIMAYDEGAGHAGGLVIKAYTERLLYPFKEDHLANDNITSGSNGWGVQGTGGSVGGLETSTSWAEMDGADPKEQRHNFVRWLVLQMIIENLAQKRASFGHLLLGFPITADIGHRPPHLKWASPDFNLDSGGLASIAAGNTSTEPTNCLHAVLCTLREPDVYWNKPQQAEACLWLLHSLCENQYTSAATLKLMRRRAEDKEDFCCAQLHKILVTMHYAAQQAAAQAGMNQGFDGNGNLLALGNGSQTGQSVLDGAFEGSAFVGGSGSPAVQRAAGLARTNAYAWLLKIIAIELRVTSSSTPPQPQHTTKLLGALFNSDTAHGLVEKQPLEQRDGLFHEQRPKSAVLLLLDMISTESCVPPTPGYFPQVEQHALHWLETRNYVWGEYRSINVQGLHESLYADGKDSQQHRAMINEGLSWAQMWNHHQKQVAVEAHVMSAWQQMVEIGLDAFKTITDLRQQVRRTSTFSFT